MMSLVNIVCFFDVMFEKFQENINISKNNENVLVYDAIDTSPGQSGSAICDFRDRIYGIHTGGAAIGGNCGTRITKKHFMWIVDKIKNDNKHVEKMIKTHDFTKMHELDVL